LTFGHVALAVTVGTALIVASSVATGIGVYLPWLFAKLGYDPAFGSGPIATVIQDVISLLIYFLIASALIL
jgi:magnesium transporter